MTTTTPPRPGAAVDAPQLATNGVHHPGGEHARRNTRAFSLGGVVAAIVLMVFGAGAIVVGARGHNEVGNNITREAITGTPDMTPAGIAAAVKGTKLASATLPTCSVAGKLVNSGSSAKCFADYMRIHALEATGGRTYSQMGQFLTAKGTETSDKTLAAKDPKTGQPVANAARNVWVTETALSTALNTSFFAQQVALFSIVMGIALLLTGIGFLVLTLGVLRRRPAAS
jgi:hypothetical protein